ncbi:unnamed protein product [Dovyalis caffra]|uniref:Uncharacterized protein n=1 Tax=Dovyalis caffra TaxID=77055 RepID=A0AAV1RYM0_9ROSI|nr:unnamed protein product [Dovyalis caffra]
METAVLVHNVHQRNVKERYGQPRESCRVKGPKHVINCLAIHDNYYDKWNGGFVKLLFPILQFLTTEGS